MVGVELIVGAGRLDRALSDANDLLVGYRTDDRLCYLDWQPSVDPNRLMPRSRRDYLERMQHEPILIPVEDVDTIPDTGGT